LSTTLQQKRNLAAKAGAFKALEQRLKEQEAEAEREKQVAEGLRDILSFLNANHTLADTLQYIVSQACRLLASEGGALCSLQEKEGVLRIQASQGLTSEYVASMFHTIGPGQEMDAVQPGQAVIDLIGKEEGNYPDPERQAVSRWLGSQYKVKFSVPLFVKNKNFGALTLYYRQERQFSAEDIALALAFADQAALAFETARLYSEAQGKAALEERQRLARELHDSVSQALFGIALGTNSALTLLEQDRDPRRVQQALEYVLSLAETGMAEMRALIFELRPESLETEGLLAGITKQAASLKSRHRIEVQLNMSEEEPDLSLEVKEALYRICQEALHNIIKHAHAKEVKLGLNWHKGEEVQLEIRDNGVGFDTGGSFPGHLGLRSMQERVERLKGRFEMDSFPGSGTHLKVKLPG
jgi:signal transduction histidine kinase